MKKIHSVSLMLVLTFWTLGVFTIQSCKKDTKTTSNTSPNDTTTGPTYMEKMFESYVLNQAVIVTMAIDSSGNNLTQTFTNEVIYLRKQTYYNGPLEIVIGGTSYFGTWKSNSDYSTLDLAISGRPEFEFYSTPWRFTYKSLTLLKLAPIKNPGSKILFLVKK